MSNVVNLGRARKRKREGAEKRRADENAIRHGRTKAEKLRERMEQTKLRDTVDGARREPAPVLVSIDAGAATNVGSPAPTNEPEHDHAPASDDEPEA